VNIVFCADRKVLPGLHVAAYSVLEKMGASVRSVSFHLFSQDLGEADESLLRKTLAGVGREFSLEFHHLDAGLLESFPTLHGSLAPYYRLMAIDQMSVDRLLYLDIDTVCDVDLSPLQNLDMGSCPAAWVSEAPMSGAVDRFTAEQLGNNPDDPYFNSGVMLVNVPEWKRQAISQKALEYITQNQPPFHDQSALNVVLYKKTIQLEEKYNTIANMRRHWPILAGSQGQTNCIMHLVDYPKPWDLGGEFIHPQYSKWRRILDKTRINNYRSWQPTPARKLPKTRNAWIGYKKCIKDRILFGLYSKRLINHVKGIKNERKDKTSK
jgi:lipopolysaccharide biosynthesis glycosyltransferase